MNTLNLSSVDEAIDFSEQMIELAERAFRITKAMATITGNAVQATPEVASSIRDYIKAVEQNERTVAAFKVALKNTKALRTALAAAPAGVTVQ